MGAVGFASLREQHRGEKRELIERAAARVFAARGFREASVADVAREAGMSAGSIYNYFASKEELLFATTFAEIAELERRMAAAIDPKANAADQLSAMIAAYHGFYRDRPEGFRMLMAGLERPMRVKGGAAAVAEYDRRAVGCLQLLHDVLEHGMREGTFREADPWELTRAIWAAFHGSLQLAASGLRWDAQELLDQTVELIFKGIATTPGGEQ